MIRAIFDFFRASHYVLPDRSPDEIRAICRILFIDDHDFDVPDILINSGWRDTKLIQDVESLDHSDIKDAHIIFVDISGVGIKLRFSDEGLGIISALKERYPPKKVVVYSARRHGDRFHPGLSDADARLAKNADPFQFETLVENLAGEVLSLDGCIQNLKNVLRTQLNISLTDEAIRNNLHKIGRSRDYSELSISKAFNIHSAGAIASIVSLFFSCGS